MNIVSLLFGLILLYIPLNSFYLQIIPPFPSRFFCGQRLPSPHPLPPLWNADGNQKNTINFNLLQLGNWKLPHHQNISLALVYANYLRVYGGKEDCKKSLDFCRISCRGLAWIAFKDWPFFFTFRNCIRTMVSLWRK